MSQGFSDQAVRQRPAQPQQGHAQREPGSLAVSKDYASTTGTGF